MGELTVAEIHVQAPVPNPQAVDAVMRTLQGFVVHHAFSFALFPLSDKLEYLFGYLSRPDEFFSAATELCQRGYVRLASLCLKT